MRIRLQLLLPLLGGVLVGLGFLLAAGSTADAVRSSLTTVPGLTRERAVEAAVRAVALGGMLATVVAVAASALMARSIVRQLLQVQRAAAGLREDEEATTPVTPVAELQDVARGVQRTTDELRERRDRALRETAELEALVEAVSEGIIRVDEDGRVERVNRASRTLLGLPQDAVGRAVAAMFRSREMREIVERGAAGVGTSATEVVVDDRRILVSVSPQPGGGAVATFVDLTDLRRLEEVRRDFVANASHELKTPLTSIRGYSETLLDTELPEPQRQQFLGIIFRNASRLQRIVDDLLDLSRLESGRWDPELQPVDPVALAESSWAALADPAGARGVRLVVEAAGGDQTLHVIADRRGLEQVFANLFDNAIRHSREGDTVRVRALRTMADSRGSGADRRGGGALAAQASAGWVVVEVTDTGSGIPRDALPRIFERFYRVDPARSRAEGGTGLGLSIVKHMVESMGGAVGAESALGKGTTIRLWLRPARPPH